MRSRGYGATAARLTPDQKVGSSNLSALICWSHHMLGVLLAPGIEAGGPQGLHKPSGQEGHTRI